MTSWFGTYQRTALVLVGLAVLIMTVLLFTNRGDLTSATLILVAFACFVTGLFLYTFRREERIDQKLAAFLTVPSTSTLSRILADLGVTGPAYFIPVTDDGTFPAPVMQFNPVAGTVPERPIEDQTFCTGDDGAGILTIPSGIPLLVMIEKDRALTLPSSEPELLDSIREVNEDLLEVADKATVTSAGHEIIVEMKNFRLIEGCRMIRAESPRNCITAPCPICSLTGIMVAKGLGKTSYMLQVLVDEEGGKMEVRIGLKEKLEREHITSIPDVHGETDLPM
jgi:hypothetical protein